MNRYTQSAILAALFIVSCSCQRNAEPYPIGPVQLIERAHELGPYPVSRSELVETLDIAELPSTREIGGIRGGVMRFYEIWEHPSGVTISAYDSEQVGDLAIVGNTIDDILNSEPISPQKYPAKLMGQDERESFNGLFLSTGKFILFNSFAPKGETGVK